MATAESIAIRRADALTRAHVALERIGASLELDLGTYPDPHRDYEMRPAVESEWLADTLESVAESLDPKGDSLASALEDRTRADLNRYASELGVNDAAKLPNKSAVIEAIRALDAETAPNEPADDADPGGEAVTEAGGATDGTDESARS